MCNSLPGRRENQQALNLVGGGGVKGEYLCCKKRFTSRLFDAGLDTIYLLTLKKTYELRVDMEDFDGQRAYAFYASFAISPEVTDPELDGYKLQVTGFKDGGAGENSSTSLEKHLGCIH